MIQSPYRLQVLKKIEEYELNGLFDQDVESDPPSKVLLPNQIDYLDKKLISKIKTGIANFVGKTYFEHQIKKKNLIIDGVDGLENALKIDSGAIITCNHFNAYDNYALYRVILPWLKKQRLYKIIREGNYTAFPGLYGFFFRNCNTLPLSSNFDTMRKFMSSVDTLLKRGEKILVYPEQGMWWNYKKPRPLKNGAFRFAARNNVPVLPCFITMADSDKLDADGFFVQKYTINIGQPIYPDCNIGISDASDKMAEQTSSFMKEVYERVYKIPLTFTTKDKT